VPSHAGAVDYLIKPANANASDVVAALLATDAKKIEPPAKPMSANRVRWEYIQRNYELYGRNVSETARQLKMHRRTLQRILAKRAQKWLFAEAMGSPTARGTPGRLFHSQCGAAARYVGARGHLASLPRARRYCFRSGFRFRRHR
jgi:hypothetical protein